MPGHDVHIARTYSTARELLELHDVDTVVVDSETGWHVSGPPLFELARATHAEALCIALLGVNDSERAAFGRRHNTGVVLDDSYPIKLVQALNGYLR